MYETKYENELCDRLVVLVMFALFAATRPTNQRTESLSVASPLPVPTIVSCNLLYS